MGRPLASAARPIPPEALPDWILRPPHSTVSDNPARHRQLANDFHAWQRRKRAWLDEHPDVTFTDLTLELRRRFPAVDR